MYILLSLLIVLLIFNYWKRKFFILSPVDIFISYFVTVLLLTTFYHFYFPRGDKFNYYGLDFIGLIKFYNGIFLYGKMLLLFVTGVILYSYFSRKYRNLNKAAISIIDMRTYKINTKMLSNVAIGLVLVSSILVYIDYGNGFFIRAQYIPMKSSILKTIYQNLFIILAVISGIIYKKNRPVSVFCITITMLVGIALGSRTASIFLLLFGVFLSLFIENRRRRALFYFYFVPIVVIFFGFNLALRSENTQHGLIPYLGMVVNKPLVLFKYVLSNIYYTFVFGFYDTIKTIGVYTFPSVHNLVTSLSPLPGAWTDWPRIAPKLRTYDTLPFTAIGEMSKFPLTSFFYYIFLGAYFAHIDKFIKQAIINKKYILSVVQFLLLTLYVVHSFEYNLRSTNRFLVYSIIIFAVAHCTRKYKFVFR